MKEEEQNPIKLNLSEVKTKNDLFGDKDDFFDRNEFYLIKK